MELKRELGIWTATLLVVASMIGSGIFGNTGIIQEHVGNPWSVLGLWFLGGLIALAGALSYAELAAAMPHAGGEYVYLKNTFGPLSSFLTGWVSFIVAFSAPAAATALLSSDYAKAFVDVLAPNSALAEAFQDEWNRKIYACALVILFSAVHMVGVKFGGLVQNVLTLLKIFLVGLFLIAGLVAVFVMQPISVPFEAVPTKVSGLGLGLLFVLFAYSGWNGATYLAEEIKDPERNLPKALFRGTLLTMILYLLLNILYYMAVPAAELAGQTAVVSLAARNLFGDKVTLFFNLAFCVMLLSSLSVYLMIGPRVYFAMARDNLFFKFASKVSPKFGTPMVSIFLQCLLSIVYITTNKYDTIMTYMGFALGVFPVLTVFGLFKLRKEGRTGVSYKTPFFPLLPLFFVFFSVLMLVLSFVESPWECARALLVVVAGAPLYYLWMYFQKINGKANGSDSAGAGKK